MQEQQTSIFDKDFILETTIRRRRLMPLALKIYVWFYLVVSALTILSSVYFYISFMAADGFNIPPVRVMLTSLGTLSFQVLLLFASLTILWEKKHAILFASIVIAISVLFRGASLIGLLFQSKLSPTDALLEAGWILLKIPYLIMLLRIKRDWETKAIAGNHPIQA